MAKIKVIDLLNNIANGGEVPKKIKWRDIIWDYWDGEQDYKSEQGRWFMSNFNYIRTKEFVTDEVEIIEDNTIDIDSIEELKFDGIFDTKNTTKNHYNKINELVQAVKQLNEEIKVLKEESK